MTKSKSKKTAPKSDYRHTSIVNSRSLKMTTDTVSFIDKLAEKDSKRKKKKEATKTEDNGIVRRLAKNSLIDKDKVKATQKLSSKNNKTKKKKGLSSSSSSFSDSSSSTKYRLL